MKQHFAMMAAYNAWANGLVYDAAGELDDAEFNRDMGAFFHSMCGTLNHLLIGDRIWMRRFTGKGEAPNTLNMIPFPALGPLRIAREVEDQRIIDWIAELSEEELAGRFTYVTVTGMRTISQRLAPALSNIFNHQTHHRGQAHMILTALGKPSLALDMIYFQRTEYGRAYA